MADQRFVNDQYSARAVEAGQDLDLNKSVVVGMPSVAARLDLPIETARFLDPVARAGRDFYQVTYQYGATLDSGKVKATETLVVDPATLYAVEVTERVFAIREALTLETKAHLRHIPSLTVTGNWQASVSLASTATQTITLLIDTSGDTYDGQVALRAGTPAGTSVSGQAMSSAPIHNAR